MEATKWVEVTRWGKVHAWWLRHPDIDADRLSVLAALSTYADEDGYCEPSQATLARWLKRSRPWVNRVIAQLVGVGLLEKTARSRANGGTTSCRYRLLSQATVASAMPPVNGYDAPRHTCDTNQAEVKQSQVSAHNARAPSTQDCYGYEREVSQLFPADWQPAEGVVERALALYPNANLIEHTALFVARCRGKGYKVEPCRADDLWLAWLVDDMRTRSHATAGKFASRSENLCSSSRGPRFSRLNAWGLAATTVAARPQQLG
jgi:hypothetical protein